MVTNKMAMIESKNEEMEVLESMGNRDGTSAGLLIWLFRPVLDRLGPHLQVAVVGVRCHGRTVFPAHMHPRRLLPLLSKVVNSDLRRPVLPHS